MSSSAVRPQWSGVWERSTIACRQQMCTSIGWRGSGTVIAPVASSAVSSGGGGVGVGRSARRSLSQPPAATRISQTIGRQRKKQSQSRHTSHRINNTHIHTAWVVRDDTLTPSKNKQWDSDRDRTNSDRTTPAPPPLVVAPPLRSPPLCCCCCCCFCFCLGGCGLPLEDGGVSRQPAIQCRDRQIGSDRVGSGGRADAAPARPLRSAAPSVSLAGRLLLIPPACDSAAIRSHRCCISAEETMIRTRLHTPTCGC